MEKKIKEYFSKNKLPKPRQIDLIGKWAKGNCYAVSCGLIKAKKYCVYCMDDTVHSVRLRGGEYAFRKRNIDIDKRR